MWACATVLSNPWYLGKIQRHTSKHSCIAVQVVQRPVPLCLQNSISRSSDHLSFQVFFCDSISIRTHSHICCAQMTECRAVYSQLCCVQSSPGINISPLYLPMSIHYYKCSSMKIRRVSHAAGTKDVLWCKHVRRNLSDGIRSCSVSS